MKGIQDANSGDQNEKLKELEKAFGDFIKDPRINEWAKQTQKDLESSQFASNVKTTMTVIGVILLVGIGVCVYFCMPNKDNEEIPNDIQQPLLDQPS